jgi:hypothetical protein
MLCNTDRKYTKQVLEYGAEVSISNFNYGFKGLAFCISHFIFFLFCFLQAPAQSKGQLSDEQLAIITSRICHFLMRDYISPCGVFHTPDGHMAKFPALCDYIKQE